MRITSYLTLALFGVMSITSAMDCDDYSFCEDPGMKIIEGNYAFGQTYGDQTCLATTQNAQSFRYGNWFVNVTSTHSIKI
jgi:hypothetical protein